MSKVLASLLVCVTSVAATASHGADQILSGAITARSGQTLEGVTVSAKLEGSTIATSVYTDSAGNYFFPPLPAGKYRVWAQALGFETNKGAVELTAARRAHFTLQDDRSRAALPPAARRDDGRGIARGERRGRPRQEDLHE